jgi:hypothetical protein
MGGRLATSGRGTAFSLEDDDEVAMVDIVTCCSLDRPIDLLALLRGLAA